MKFTAPKQSKDAVKNNNANKSSRMVEFSILGMHCSSCAKNIENVLMQMSEISLANVNSITQKAKLFLNAKITLDTIKKIIASAGHYKIPEQRLDLKLNEKMSQDEIENMSKQYNFVYSLETFGENHLLLRLASNERTSHNFLQSLKNKKNIINLSHSSRRFQSFKIFFVELSVILTCSLGMLMATCFFENDKSKLHWLFSTPIIFFSGRSILLSGLKGFHQKKIGMPSLVTLSVLTAYFESIFSIVFLPNATTHFDMAVWILLLTLVGKLLEQFFLQKNQTILSALTQHEQHLVKIKKPDGMLHEIQTNQLQKDDIMLISASEIIPVDGILIEGKGKVQSSISSGKLQPIFIEIGNQIQAGAINLEQPLFIQALTSGLESPLHFLKQNIQDIKTKQSKLKKITDRIAEIFTPCVIAFAFCTLLFWSATNGFNGDSISKAISVLLVACPCALGLAVPIVTATALGVGFKKGILIQNPDVFEKITKIKAFIFDKTGTLTEGYVKLEKIIPSTNMSEQKILCMGASLSYFSSHPIALSIRNACHEKKLEPFKFSWKMENITEIPGAGIFVKTKKNNIELALGNAKLMKYLNIQSLDFNSKTHGEKTVFMILHNCFVGTFIFSDPLKKSIAILGFLKQKGFKTILMTGERQLLRDSETKFQKLFDEMQYECTPQAKLHNVISLQNKGIPCAMVGDGLNDAMALAQSDLSICMVSGADVSLITSDAILFNSNLHLLSSLINLGTATCKKIKFNLIWIFAYNIITIPLAALGMLTPPWAILTMSLSSLGVIFNGLSLGRKHW